LVATIFALGVMVHACLPGPFVTLIETNFWFARPAIARSYVRGWGNFGMGIGAGLTAVTLGMVGDGAIRWVPLANGLTFLAAAALLGLVRSRPVVFRSGPKVDPIVRLSGMPAFLALTATLGLHSSILAVGFPLWIAASTLPSWLPATLVWANTLVVTVFQVRVSTWVDRGGSRPVAAARRAGLLTAFSCLIMMMPDSATVFVCLLMFLTVTVSELLQNALYFFFSFEIGPDARRAEVASMLHLSQSAESLGGPLVFSLTMGIGPWMPWLVLAIASAVAASRYESASRRILLSLKALDKV